MAINTPVDPMQELEEEMVRSQEKKSGFAPFFFLLRDGEKALVRPLLNMRDYVKLNFHELYNPSTKKFDVSSVCAKDFGHECQHCVDAEHNSDPKQGKKLAAHKRFYLPIYVHSAQKYDVASKTWVPVVYTDQDGNEQTVKGVRILEMKASSPILSSLVAAYNEDDQHDISRLDFVIARKGSGTDTDYTTTLRPQARALPNDLPSMNQGRIKSDVEMARPMKAVGAPVAASASNGKVEDSGIPDF